jgi:hypothetical protein
MPRTLRALTSKSVSLRGQSGPSRRGRRCESPTPHAGQIADKSLDCSVAASLAAWRLGRPPLSGFDSILGAVWPGTGVREKGKASPGLIQALQSLPLPVFGASALRNVGDRRRKHKRRRRCACPGPDFSANTCPSEFLPVHFFTLRQQTLHPFTISHQQLVAFKTSCNSW